MATTKDNKVGRTRIKLAAMLSAALSDHYRYPITVEPEDLQSQIPFYAHNDCVSWTATVAARIPTAFPGETVGVAIHLCSWTTMGQIVREKEIAFVRGESRLPHHFEVA